MNYFLDSMNGKANLTKRYKEINSDFRKMYADRDILFLTQSDGRYLSSWLNILRDDFGCLSFASRTTNRQVVYNLSELNDIAFKQKIRENTHSTKSLLFSSNILNKKRIVFRVCIPKNITRLCV